MQLGELPQFPPHPTMFLHQQLRAPPGIGAPGVSLKFRKRCKEI